MPGRRKSGKNAPIFSHEFIITNHGDIVSCICMVFMVGLMFQATAKLASVFIVPQYNITQYSNETNQVESLTYTVGGKDVLTILFYSLAWIVVHAIIQEYIWDKISRKLHLSKTKNSKFNDSGGLVPFFAASVIWGVDLIVKEELIPHFSKLWEGYPHNEMTFTWKFYFVLQIAYWIHCFPEMYFMKVKKEEIWPKVEMYLQYILFISAAYMLRFTRVALLCLVLHYSVEFFFHISRILAYGGKTELSRSGFSLWSILFMVTRFATILMAVVVFSYGLANNNDSGLTMAQGNFNIPPIRTACLAGIVLMQAWMAWNFITFQIKRWRESSASSPFKKKEPKKKGKKENEKKYKKEVNEDDAEEADSIEEHEDVHGNGLANGKVKKS